MNKGIVIEILRDVGIALMIFADNMPGIPFSLSSSASFWTCLGVVLFVRAEIASEGLKLKRWSVKVDGGVYHL